jgi:hypothetical protein
MMRWGVEEAPACDGLVVHGHDDLLVSATLVVILDRQEWPGTGKSVVAEREDVFEEVDGASGEGSGGARESAPTVGGRAGPRLLPPTITTRHLSTIPCQ